MDISHFQEDMPEPLQPTRIESVSLSNDKEIIVPPGYTLVQPLDNNGLENAQPFLIGTKTYNKSFANKSYENGNPKYKNLDQSIKSQYYENYSRVSTKIAENIPKRCGSCGK